MVVMDGLFASNTIDVCVTDPPYGMGMEQWDHSVPPKEAWEEVLRVLKPGAFCLSFCSPMLYHRLAVNMEDAGFVIKDQLIWMVTTKMASAEHVNEIRFGQRVVVRWLTPFVAFQLDKEHPFVALDNEIWRTVAASGLTDVTLIGNKRVISTTNPTLQHHPTLPR